jgi:quercetin dioxygenase-like cupin family protein
VETPRLGFVHPPGDGEALAVPNGEVVIHVDPGTGSPRFALGTQTLRPGAGIGLHVHEHEEEVLFVHRGNGVGLLGDDRTPVVPGSTIFIPQGVWHGVDNPESEVTLLWVVSPPGLESYFREVGSRPGEAPKVLAPNKSRRFAGSTECAADRADSAQRSHRNETSSSRTRNDRTAFDGQLWYHEYESCRTLSACRPDTTWARGGRQNGANFLLTDTLVGIEGFGNLRLPQRGGSQIGREEVTDKEDTRDSEVEARGRSDRRRDR